MAYAFHRIQKGLKIDAILRMTAKTEKNGMNGQFELKRHLEAKILQLQNENRRLRKENGDWRKLEARRRRVNRKADKETRELSKRIDAIVAKYDEDLAKQGIEPQMNPIYAIIAKEVSDDYIAGKSTEQGN